MTKLEIYKQYIYNTIFPTQVKNGIMGHLYTLTHDVFNNSVPENSCFNVGPSTMPDGIFDMGACSSSKPCYGQIFTS